MDNSSASSFEVPESLTVLAQSARQQFHRLPGSAIFVRYVKSSYQNDPVRSALELFLVIFAIRYLLAPKYSTKPGKVVLSEDVSCFDRSYDGGRRDKGFKHTGPYPEVHKERWLTKSWVC
jgi:hypothetical protein